jgi:hypothetical protein
MWSRADGGRSPPDPSPPSKFLRIKRDRSYAAIGRHAMKNTSCLAVRRKRRGHRDSAAKLAHAIAVLPRQRRRASRFPVNTRLRISVPGSGRKNCQFTAARIFSQLIV